LTGVEIVKTAVDGAAGVSSVNPAAEGELLTGPLSKSLQLVAAPFLVAISADTVSIPKVNDVEPGNPGGTVRVSSATLMSAPVPPGCAPLAGTPLARAVTVADNVAGKVAMSSTFVKGEVAARADTLIPAVFAAAFVDTSG
jgi:hypothetical protein